MYFFGPYMTNIRLARPRICRFVYRMENYKQSNYELLYKLIVYTLPSIWHYSFFQNAIQIQVNIRNKQNQKIGFGVVLYCLLVLPIGPVIPLWKNRALLFPCGITAAVICRERAGMWIGIHIQCNHRQRGGQR